MNWHLFFITIFFFATMMEIADFAHSLKTDKSTAGSLAFCSTVLFLLITWNEW